ncbi:MAG: alcohol dehydrogenase catalytic domain-containing protein, partial [Porphyrobacter sp.]|nr:alcohol dehydrogenase catalytic domain-containing protein [Porphyrobacter sp.]
MKAFILDKYARGAALRLGELPDPVLTDTGVLVEIHAAGLNPLDHKIRDGEFKLILPLKPPFALGSDLAGVVKAVGPKVSGFKPGDEVFARIDAQTIGTLAE